MGCYRIIKLSILAFLLVTFTNCVERSEVINEEREYNVYLLFYDRLDGDVGDTLPNFVKDLYKELIIEKKVNDGTWILFPILKLERMDLDLSMEIRFIDTTDGNWVETLFTNKRSKDNILKKVDMFLGSMKSVDFFTFNKGDKRKSINEIVIKGSSNYFINIVNEDSNKKSSHLEIKRDSFVNLEMKQAVSEIKNTLINNKKNHLDNFSFFLSYRKQGGILFDSNNLK